MKELIVCLLVCFPMVLVAQDYEVVHVSGELMSNKTHKIIKVGDKVTKDEVIVVNTSKSKCLLFDGKQKLTLKSNDSKKQGEVNDMFAIVPDRQLIGSRGDNDSAYVKISDFFKAETYLFMDTVEQILLNENYIKDLGNNKFLIVDSADKKTLINFKDSKLKIETSKIFKDGESEATIKIYRINTATGEFIKEVQIKVSKLDSDVLLKEIKIVSKLIDVTLTETEKIKETYSVIVDIYGGLNFQKFEVFYKANMLQ